MESVGSLLYTLVFDHSLLPASGFTALLTSLLDFLPYPGPSPELEKIVTPEVLKTFPTSAENMRLTAHYISDQIYEALTGELPITAANRRDLLDLHQRQVPISMRKRRPDLDIPEELLADRDLEQAAGALHRVAFDDLVPLAEEHGADVVGFEVQRESGYPVGQVEHLQRHAVVEPVNTGDTVSDREHGADLGQVGATGVDALDALPQNAGNLVWLDLHLGPNPP